MSYNYNNIIAGIELGEDDYFKNHREKMISSTIKFIKNSLRDGHGSTFINGEKDRLRMIINCKNLDELVAVEQNLLNSNIKTNLSSRAYNKMKQSSRKREVKSRLVKKLMKKNSINVMD